MVYMQDHGKLGLITDVVDKVVTIHWFNEKTDHMLSFSALFDAIEQGVYEVLGMKKGRKHAT
jgi:hypothetical protein